MKKKYLPIVLSLSLSLLLLISVTVNAKTFTVLSQGPQNNPQNNMQGVWIATVFNMDFPTTKNNIDVAKEEFVEKLDKLKTIGINTIVVQVRPKADALYKSAINPWSDVLTGVQGKNPGYDPMAFMINEAHKRGMFFHAWLNPYRITTSGTNINLLDKNHPARLHPDWVIKYNNALYYNPGLEAVKNHITSTVKEIVKNYDVDAIDFDDYFYPSNYPLPKGEGRDGKTGNDRRQNINDMIKRVSNAIKAVKKNVSFGVSPEGIWKNSSHDSTGSKTAGNESYYSVYGDTRTWIKNQWIDYVAPQIYWEIGNKAADYETLVKWWSNEVKGTKVKLYINHNLCGEKTASQVDKQLKIDQNYQAVSGSFYYNLKSILLDVGGCKEKIAAYNINKECPKSTKLSTVKTPDSSKIGDKESESSHSKGSGVKETVGTTILAAPRATVNQAKNWAKSNKATDEFINLADIYWKVCPKCGVDPVVAYVQSAKETSFGKFNGVVEESFHNPCGLKKKTGGSNYNKYAHCIFCSWEDGICAQADHLALYAGAAGYPKGSTKDPRQFPSLKGTATTVEALGGKWARSLSYGTDIVKMMKKLELASNAPCNMK